MKIYFTIILFCLSFTNNVFANDWSGFYAGLSLTNDKSDSQFNDRISTINARTPDTIKNTDNTKASIGLNLGYKRQFSNNFVAGITGDYFPQEYSKQVVFYDGQADIFEKLSEAKSLSVSLGYNFEKWLPYVSIGKMSLKQNYAPVHATLGHLDPVSHTRNGDVIGAGISYMISENNIISFEYSNADFGSKETASPNLTSTRLFSDLQIERSIIKISKKF